MRHDRLAFRRRNAEAALKYCVRGVEFDSEA